MLSTSILCYIELKIKNMQIALYKLKVNRYIPALCASPDFDKPPT